MLTLIQGIKPINEVDRFDVIMLGTTVYGELTQGFQLDIATKYPYVNEANIKQSYGDLRRLGTRLTVHKPGDPIITLLYICAKNGVKKYSLDLKAFIHSLQTANNEFKGMRVVSPVIGMSKWDGNKDKEEMLNIIEENTPDLNLFVFDQV